MGGLADRSNGPAGAGAGIVVATGGEAAGGLRGLEAAHVGPLRESIEAVLNEPSFRRSAWRIATEIANLPTLDKLVDQLM